MIRFKIDLKSTELLDRITTVYNFRRDTITSRIAIAISIESGKLFSDEEPNLLQDGREYTPTSNIFGRLVNDTENFILYKSVFDQHYKKDLTESEFIQLYKHHLSDGLRVWDDKINKIDITKGGHISILLKNINSGLALRSNTTLISTGIKRSNINEFKDVLSFELGKTENDEIINININDLREFDNRNIAIAGMAGSGKTQLIKDILYQISKNTNNELKFIFFDYKGEGDPTQLKSFLNSTNCEFVDVIESDGVKFNPFLAINLDKRQRHFSIRAFVDTISMFVPGLGVSQKNILIKLINDLLDRKEGSYPTVKELFDDLERYYEVNAVKPDTLYSVIRDLSANIFNCDPNNPEIFSKSLYLNLPPALSDTLRQLIVFFLLRYFNSFFSSTNDCIPDGPIFPLRYVIVIDEAHIYLKNKNARKALEELLRLLRSKGVIVVMLSQGVEDYKTKDFDFASQVKLPICLNIQNKDYKAISNFIGTPKSKFKLEAEIQKLESKKGLINIGEPKTIKIRQWWQTKKSNNL